MQAYLWINNYKERYIIFTHTELVAPCNSCIKSCSKFDCSNSTEFVANVKLFGIEEVGSEKDSATI